MSRIIRRIIREERKRSISRSKRSQLVADIIGCMIIIGFISLLVIYYKIPIVYGIIMIVMLLYTGFEDRLVRKKIFLI